MMLPEKLYHQLDKLGMGVSILCAVHCAALPLIITALPLLGLQVFANPITEITIICLSLIIGLTSLSIAFLQHKSLQPLLLMVTGFMGIFAGHYLISESYEWLFLTLGGLTVATAHYLNWQLMKRSAICTLQS